ncbi:BON domain-containing protein [Nitrospira sp. M1]
MTTVFPGFKKPLLMFLLFTMMFALVGYSVEAGHGTDGQTEGAIERRLQMDARINAKHIGVKVENGHAKLFGTVETLEERALATTIGGSLIGVQSVNNAIEIERKVGQDRQTRNRIERLLESAMISDNDNITVRATNGTVTLEGTVLQLKDKRKAFRVAQSVSGVKEVENLIQVVDSERTDKEIYNDVILYLMWSPILDIDELKTEVNDGIVSLQGSVDHLAHRDVLIIDIENIHGVKEVKVGKVVPKSLKAFSTNSTENS